MLALKSSLPDMTQQLPLMFFSVSKGIPGILCFYNELMNLVGLQVVLFWGDSSSRKAFSSCNFGEIENPQCLYCSAITPDASQEGLVYVWDADGTLQFNVGVEEMSHDAFCLWFFDIAIMGNLQRNIIILANEHWNTHTVQLCLMEGLYWISPFCLSSNCSRRKPSGKQSGLETFTVILVIF